MATMVNQKTKYLISKWGKRIGLVEKTNGAPLSFEKKAALANALENTSDRMRAMEATNPGSIGAYKRYALDIITATVPNLIAFDMYAVQAMDNRIGMINYLDYRYSKAKGETPAGHVFASSINMGKSDPEYSSNVVTNEKAAISSNAVDTVLSWSPVILDTVVVKSADGSIAGTADSTGAITGTGITSGSGSYVTVDGTLKLALSSTSLTELSVSYLFDNESVRSDGFLSGTQQNYVAGNGAYAATGVAAFTNVPEIELKMNSVPVEAQARTLRSFWAFDAAYELQKEYGADIETLLATQVTGELAHEIDNELTFDLLRFANAGAPVTWSRVQPVGVSLVDHYDSFNAKLVEGSNQIFNATRRVKANFIVCGLEVASVIEVMRNFTGSGVVAVGPHFLGTLGTLKVFVNPDFPANEFVLGYKGSTMFDAGAFYCPYMPISSTDLIMDSNFRGQRGWATMYGKKLLNSKMYLKGAIV